MCGKDGKKFGLEFLSELFVLSLYFVSMKKNEKRFRTEHTFEHNKIHHIQSRFQ